MPWPRRSSSNDLVARLADGDEQAWTDLYTELAGTVAGYARSKGVRDADDLVGDVFAAAASRIGSFEGDPRQLRAWIFTIAHHRLADDVRRRKRRATEPTEPASLEHLVETATAHDDADSRLDAGGALEMLDWVTDDQREVLTLRILGDLTIAETAEVMAKPPGAVKALQHRALARIQRRLDGTPYPIGSDDDDGGDA